MGEGFRLEPILGKWQLLALDLALMPIGLAEKRLFCEGTVTRDGHVLGSVLCGRQTVHVPVAAFGDMCELVPPDEVKEGAMQDILLSRTPCMF